MKQTSTILLEGTTPMGPADHRERRPKRRWRVTLHQRCNITLEPCWVEGACWFNARQVALVLLTERGLQVEPDNVLLRLDPQPPKEKTCTSTTPRHEAPPSATRSQPPRKRTTKPSSSSSHGPTRLTRKRPHRT